jgi:hypothetical protein
MTERPLASCPVMIRRIFFNRGLRLLLLVVVVFFTCLTSLPGSRFVPINDVDAPPFQALTGREEHRAFPAVNFHHDLMKAAI